MTVDQQSNRPSRPTPVVKGRHRIRPGVPLPGFPRVGGTREEYKATEILARHGRRVVSEDEAGAR